jgi:hypothetical protein
MGVFAGVFGEFWVLGVVFLWRLRGKVCGEGGQEDVSFWGVEFSHFF